MGSLNRRQFFKIMGLNIAGALLPLDDVFDKLPVDWPKIDLSTLPKNIQEIVSITPRTYLSPGGNLFIEGPESKDFPALLVQTRWNRIRSRNIDLLARGLPWAIVYHWYGDDDSFDQSIKGYLRGFDRNKLVNSRSTQTSAHFLVGMADVLDLDRPNSGIDILQLQEPSPSGDPFLASSLTSALKVNNGKARNYFLRAAEKLKFQDPRFHSILIDLFTGQSLDPNLRAIAIEITGKNFNQRDHYPGTQKLANVLSVTWAIMKRYGLSAANLVGHHEIQKEKSDPGNKFMAMIRFLVGIYGLLENDRGMKMQIFGSYLSGSEDFYQAVKNYFGYIFEYLSLVAAPKEVYEWETWSKYWEFIDVLQGNEGSEFVAGNFISPLAEIQSERGTKYLEHQGQFSVRLFPVENEKSPVQLIGNGLCLYTGKGLYYPSKKGAVFQHRLSNGSKIISIFDHLDELDDLIVGNRYPAGKRIGFIRPSQSNSFLSLATAYASAWDAIANRLEKGYIHWTDAEIEETFFDPSTIIYLNYYPQSEREQKILDLASTTGC